MWTHIRLLLLEQCDLDLHSLSSRLLRYLSRRQKKFVIGAIRLIEHTCHESLNSKTTTERI